MSENVIDAGGESRDSTDSWSVVDRPPEGPSAVGSEASTDLERALAGGVGILAVETEPRVWRGIWTVDPDRILAMNRNSERQL